VKTGTQRFTFGWIELFDGIDFVVIAMGILGIAELISTSKRRRRSANRSLNP